MERCFIEVASLRKIPALSWEHYGDLKRHLRIPVFKLFYTRTDKQSRLCFGRILAPTVAYLSLRVGQGGLPFLHHVFQALKNPPLFLQCGFLALPFLGQLFLLLRDRLLPIVKIVSKPAWGRRDGRRREEKEVQAFSRHSKAGMPATFRSEVGLHHAEESAHSKLQHPPQNIAPVCRVQIAERPLTTTPVSIMKPSSKPNVG